MADVRILTQPTRILGRVTSGAGTTNYLIGSATIPANKRGQLTKREYAFAGGTVTAAKWFFIKHNVLGTLDFTLVEQKHTGADNRLGGAVSDITDITEPIESFPPGTVNVYSSSPGSNWTIRCNLRIDLV